MTPIWGNDEWVTLPGVMMRGGENHTWGDHEGVLIISKMILRM